MPYLSKSRVTLLEYDSSESKKLYKKISISAVQKKKIFLKKTSYEGMFGYHERSGK